MRYLVGIDGGGTKTHMRVTDCSRRELFSIYGDTTNPCAVGMETACRNLRALFQACAEKLQPEDQLYACCLGAAGAAAEENANSLRAYLERLLACPNIRVENDAYIAMVAMLETRAGISITAGTGSICCGQDRNGRFHRVGGWGHLFSDEGSAYQISISALRAVFRMIDGRAEKSALFELVEQKLGRRTTGELITYFYDGQCDKKGIAALAPLVDQAAQAGDRTAICILEQAARELFELAVSLIGILRLEDEPFDVTINGGVLKKSEIVRDRFCSEICASYPEARFLSGTRDAAWGAIDLAFEFLRDMDQQDLK